MTANKSNVTGIQEVDQPQEDQTEGVTQKTLTPSPAGIQDVPIAPILAKPAVEPATTDGPAKPVEIQPIAAPQIQTIAQAPETKVETAPVVQQAPQIQTVAQAPVTQAEIQPVGPAIQGAPKRGIDFTETERLLEQRKADTEADLNRRVTTQKAADFNTLTHNAIAKNRDSGFLNATKMHTIRSNNNRLFDGLNTINTQFTNDMIGLSREKAKADADFNDQEFMDWQNSHNDVYNSLLEAGDFDAAFDYAKTVADAGGGASWDARANPGNESVLRANFDKNITDQFNASIVNPNLEIALGTNLDSPQSMGENKNRIKQNLNLMPDQADWHVKNFFSAFDSENPQAFDDYGLEDQADADIVKEYLDGNIDFTDPDLQDIYAEGLIRSMKSQKDISDRRAIYGDLYTKYQSSPTATNLLDAVTKSNFGESGAVSFDGSNISTYGIPLNANNVNVAPGLDYHFSDWEGNDYVDGTDFNFETSLDDPIQVGNTTFTNGELNDMYEQYHIEQGKDYSTLPDDQKGILRQQVFNKDEFKEEIQNLLQDGNSKADLPSLLSGKKKVDVAEGEQPEFIESDQFVSPDGETTNFSQLGIDIDAFDPDERAIVESITQGDKSIHDLSSDELTNLQSMDDDILRNLADAGYMNRSSVTTDQFTPGSGGILDIGNNSSNNMFTGENTINLFNSLKDGSGYVMIGEDMYFVNGKAGRHNTKGNSGIPVIDWTITAVTGDKSGEKETYKGQLTDDSGGVTRVDRGNASSFAAALAGDVKGVQNMTSVSGFTALATYYDQITSKEVKDALYNNIKSRPDNDFVKKYQQEFGTGGN